MDEQLELFDIPSPCVGVCTSGAGGFCQGCYRSRNERFNWNTFTRSQKADVIKQCRQRKIQHILALRRKRMHRPQVYEDTQTRLF